MSLGKTYSALLGRSLNKRSGHTLTRQPAMFRKMWPFPESWWSARSFVALRSCTPQSLGAAYAPNPPHSVKSRLVQPWQCSSRLLQFSLDPRTLASWPVGLYCNCTSFSSFWSTKPGLTKRFLGGSSSLCLSTHFASVLSTHILPMCLFQIADVGRYRYLSSRAKAHVSRRLSGCQRCHLPEICSACKVQV